MPEEEAVSDEVLEGMADVFFALQKRFIETGQVPDEDFMSEVVNTSLGLTFEEFTTLRTGIQQNETDRTRLVEIINQRLAE